MSTTLRGMTWSHPRGYDPMVAASARWKQLTGVEIRWDKRSLQDFESFPVAELAARYDLIVIDHPHVGQITGEGCLLPLDVDGREAERADLERFGVGRSYPSYHWEGRQWAFPIDAATQVQAYRPDRLAAPLKTFDEVLALASAGRVLLPLRPPHSLMCLYTLAAHAGRPLVDDATPEVDRDAGIAAYAALGDLAGLVDPDCFDMDPIAVFERMAVEDAAEWCAPLAYGYVSYAIEGFRPRRIAFADMPVDGDRPTTGSALGGTGIAVSARTREPVAALDFAFWVASGEVQRSLYANAGGQPGHALAWEDEAVNAATCNFYRATRATLEGAWVRPRHDGYMRFQEEGSVLLTDALGRGVEGKVVIEALAELYRASF